ncbi:hypothetical protein GEV33_008384 [Tenebrio molitor]|uniref:Acyltransferase n=1 Tax=Tenebrio molitor TaxID=7067 RepID=A0A8J6HHF3_TENMO|nr:hypothetical protein GEV33_008384 [Tenebrio molitor]
MPGGAVEAYNSQPGKYKFVVKKRKGFVKVALKNGSPLVPVISFGETDLFRQIDNRALRNVQEFLRKYFFLGLPPVVFMGRGFFQYSFGMIPRRKQITTVRKILMGIPVEVTKLENPTNEQIEELHDKFVQALVALFDEYKYKKNSTNSRPVKHLPSSQMKVLGIEFAPLVVPMHRRYETLAVAAWLFLAAFGGLTGLLVCIYLLFTRLWWLVPLYATWTYLDRHVGESGGRSNFWMQNWRWWYHLKNYFPVETHCVPSFSLDPTRNYLFCCFPHGIIPVGPFTALANTWSNFRKSYPEFTVKLAVLHALVLLPIVRELGLAYGTISCSIKSLNYELSRPEGGHIVNLMPGGAVEAYNSQPGKWP